MSRLSCMSLECRKKSAESDGHGVQRRETVCGQRPIPVHQGPHHSVTTAPRKLWGHKPVLANSSH